jgi:hypothetical protein
MSDFANVVVEKGAAFVALGGVRVIIVPARPGKDPRGVSRLWISLAPRSGAPPVSAALTRTGMVLSPAASVAKDRA